MRRKVIKQGQGGLTIHIPKKWADFNSLKGGEEIEIEEENNQLKIAATGYKTSLKTATVTLNQFSGVELNDLLGGFRSLLGGFYRFGYDEIKVTYANPKIVPQLQKIVDSLYGFEIFDVGMKSCIIKSVYGEEKEEIKNHIQKMIHTIKTMQTIILDDIGAKKFESKDLLFQFHHNVQKQRDIVARVILSKKLIDNKHFPYYNLAFNLWNVARNYYKLYSILQIKPKLSPKNYDFFKKINAFFDLFFGALEKHNHLEIHRRYMELSAAGFELMADKKEMSFVISYCVNILYLIQSSNSSVLLLNY